LFILVDFWSFLTPKFSSIFCFTLISSGFYDSDFAFWQVVIRQSQRLPMLNACHYKEVNSCDFVFLYPSLKISSCEQPVSGLSTRHSHDLFISVTRM
jgi:hypothetical protein